MRVTAEEHGASVQDVFLNNERVSHAIAAGDAEGWVDTLTYDFMGQLLRPWESCVKVSRRYGDVRIVMEPE